MSAARPTQLAAACRNQAWFPILASFRTDGSNCRIYLSKLLYSAQSLVVRHSKVARRNPQQSFSRGSQPTCHSGEQSRQLVVSLNRLSVGRQRNYAEKTVWLLSRLLFVYPRDQCNAATSRTLVNPAVIYIL